jgi:hypothetical protein
MLLVVFQNLHEFTKDAVRHFYGGRSGYLTAFEIIIAAWRRLAIYKVVSCHICFKIDIQILIFKSRPLLFGLNELPIKGYCRLSRLFLGDRSGV